MKFFQRSLTGVRCGALLLFCSFFSNPSAGQDIPTPLDYDAGSPLMRLHSGETLAEFLLEYYEVVADGEFFAVADPSPEDVRSLKRQSVRVKFRVRELYKGTVTDPVDVELVNDMLVLPGENVARYVKRRQILDQRRLDLKPVWKQKEDLEHSYRTGEMDRRTYEAERDRLSALVAQRIRRDGLADGHIRVGAIHGETFYDVGGAIRPGQKYLIGVNRKPDSKDVYVLEEDPNMNNIYWGEMRDYVLPALGELARTGPAGDE